MKTKKRGLIIGAVVTAFAIVGTSFALWATTLSGNGSVSASGSWQVEFTDADLSVNSTGTAVSAETYALDRANVKDDTLVAATISSGKWLSAGQQDLVGTQSGEAMSQYTCYYAVDTAKYDLSDITAITKDEYAEISADSSTFVVSDHLNMYYRYVNDGTAGTADGAKASAAKVVDGLLRDTAAALKELYPDTWQNYALVNMDQYGKWNYIIASMKKTSVSGSDLTKEERASFTADEVSFAGIVFSLPGAWAQYSVTVTTTGSVDAKLENAVIRLDTENEDQLSLDAPDLTGKTLSPGESCTIQVVVKALDNGTGSLNASGRLVIELPYAQDTVEPAPDASYTK